MLAHELRNPLSTVVNALHIVDRTAGDDGRVHRAVELGLRQIHHTSRLLDDLPEVLTVDLPEAPVWVYGDPTRLEQCVGNLLGNAVKFTPSGGAIRVSVQADGDSTVVVVRDTGIAP
jgi:signal transduction histidine kinase